MEQFAFSTEHRWSNKLMSIGSMLWEKYLSSTRTTQHVYTMGGIKTLYSRNSLSRTMRDLNLNLKKLFLTLTWILLTSEQSWLNENTYNSTVFFITLLSQNSTGETPKTKKKESVDYPSIHPPQKKNCSLKNIILNHH